MAAKSMLARLPVGYRAWKRPGLFLHGARGWPDYAYGVFERHFDGVDFA